MNMENPFDLLRRYEQRARREAACLPADIEISEWVGLGFRIGNNRIIADMKDVKEILKLPEFTAVPGVKTWIIGIANVRGSLLPIMDLKGYLTGNDILKRQKGRVIVIEYKGFNTGLLVEEIYGMRHLTQTEEVEEMPDLEATIKPYIIKKYKQGDEYWPVISFEKMTSDDRFVTASL